jgi:hypothetical protein
VAAMVYINIPYCIENERIDRDITTKELSILGISEREMSQAFAAIYNRLPRGVSFDEPKKALLLEAALGRLGVGYRRSNESEYMYE